MAVWLLRIQRKIKETKILSSYSPSSLTGLTFCFSSTLPKMEEKKEKRDQIDIILVLFMNCGGRDRGRGRRVDEMAWKKENKGDSDQ